MQTKPHPQSHQGTQALDPLETSHESFLDVLDHFQNLLRGIHFEGKVRLGENLKQMSAVITFFKKDIYRHFKREEEILFPFLKSHIPKLEIATLLLAAEHQDP